MSESTKSRETVTVVIPTLNVADFIAACLDQLAFADEVIVVDMFSTDATKEICTRYPNVRFVERKDYIFGNVNHGFELANTDWVIRLDSDEVLDKELQQEILRVLANPEAGVNTYNFLGLHYMFGLPMWHGVGGLKPRRHMFRKGTAAYPVKGEHEDIEAQGEFRTLGGKYEHFTNHTTEEVIKKFNYYTSKDSERWPRNELYPPNTIKLLRNCTRSFILYYIKRKGYKDGALGLFSSLFRGPIYTLIEEAKRWERWRKETGQK